MTKTNIEWTTESWNPVVGCSILSPGCTNCYAMAMAHRIEAANVAARAEGRTSAAWHYDGTTKLVNGHAVWTGKLALAPEHTLLGPLKRKKPTTYFVNSMGDLFHEAVPDEWIDKVFAVMALCPQHTFQVLTKRADRMREYLNAVKSSDMRWKADQWIAIPNYLDVRCPEVWPLPNVWLGVSTERQQEADERIPLLYQTPAVIRFASFEPLLGRIKIPLRMKLQNNGGIVMPVGLDWAIAGAESGPGARDCDIDWVRYLKDQCVPQGIAFFYKQHAIKGRKITTPELDGRRWIEMPALPA